jgi:adenosylhomocysteine nucleosidase
MKRLSALPRERRGERHLPARSEGGTGWVNVVVALPAEARPLASAFGLRPVAGCDPFRVFSAERVRLIVSGPGKAAAAAAAGYLFRLGGGCRDQGWLNAGVGGHGSHPPGSAFLAHKVSDGCSLESWYPPRVFSPPCPGEEVLTVGSVERAYPRPVIYEMEAAGFMAACLRFSTAELVQVLKIVSDNPRSPARGVSGRRVSALLAGQQGAIRAVQGSLAGLAGELEELSRLPEEPELFFRAWRFTATQQHQLRDLLRRWRLLFPGRSALQSACGQKQARGVIRQLGLELEAAALEIGLP